jgi:molybdopterin molybdotransferase
MPGASRPISTTALEATHVNPRPPLLSLDEALERLLQCAAAHAVAETEAVSTFDGLGRVLAAEVRSAIDVPGADNSSMDGYALRVADAAAGSMLPVAQRIPAGVVGSALAAGTAARGPTFHRRRTGDAG